VQDSGGVS